MSTRVLGRPAGLHLQQRLDPAEGIDKYAVLVDQEAGRHEPVEQPVVQREQPRADRAGARRRGTDHAVRRRAARQRQLEVAGQRDVALLAVDLRVLVDRVELVEQAAGVLARPEEKEPPGLQREVEERQDGLLRVRLEVDQQVPAGDQVEPRERRVADQVVRREHDALAERLRDLIAVLAQREEPLPALAADTGDLLFGIEAGARHLQRCLVHVGGEDLDVHRPAARGQRLVQEDGNRVGLLAGGATRHPHPDLLVRLAPVHDLRDDPLLHHLERLLVAEEPRHADEQVLVQGVELPRIAAQLVQVGLDVERSVQRQPPFDTTCHRARLVVREVDSALVAEQPQDRVDAPVLDGRVRRHRH
jgi:hypothetical protein